MEGNPEDHTQFVPKEEVHEPSNEALIDFSTNQIDDALLNKFEQAIYKHTASFQHYSLSRIAREYDPIDLAKSSTKLPLNARIFLFRNLPDLDAKTSFIINTVPTTRFAIFRAIPDDEVRQLLENMPPDEAVPVLEDLSMRRVKRVFDLLDEHKARRIMALQQHRRQTAGRLMTNEFFSFPLETTVGEAVAFIRDHPGVEFTQSIFVLGADMDLVGQVSDRNLIVNAESVPLNKIMIPVLHRVGPETSRDDVVDIFERYRLSCLPVVDTNDWLIGVITLSDAVEMMEEIADETIASIGGTAEGTAVDETTWYRFRARAPWLIVTLFAGMATAIGFSLFQGEPWFLAVPFFTPLITGMSGNVGIQCSTVLIRSMATGEISSKTAGPVIARELRIGSLIGVCFGAMCGIAAYALNLLGIQHTYADPFLVGTIVCSGVLGGCFTATVLGTLSPLFFHKYRIDPAIASGPIVTACNDVLSTYMYFFAAWLVATLFAVLF
jgi:magnesium transporter